MTNDHGWVSVTGLELPETSIGVHPEERETPRTMRLNVGLWTSIQRASLSDSVEDVIDFDAIAAIAREIAAAKHYNLVETLAETLCAAIWAKFRVRRLRLELFKPSVCGGATASVAIDRCITDEGIIDTPHANYPLN